MYRLLTLAALGVAQVAATQPAPATLTGRWLVALAPPGRGETVFRMEVVQAGPASWTAHSRRGAAQAFATGNAVTRLFRKAPANGALVWVAQGTIDTSGGTTRLRGLLESPLFGAFHLDAPLAGETFSGQLRREPDGPKVGEVHAVRDTSDVPLRDYPAIAGNVRRALTGYLFDPRLPSTGSFRSFLAHLDRRLRDARDDLDVLAAFHSRVRALGTSGIDLVRDPALAVTPLEQLSGRTLVPPDSVVHLAFTTPGVAHLEIRAWDQVARPVDGAFMRIDSARPHTLIVDVRGSDGDVVAAALPLGHLYGDSVDVAVLLARKWFGIHAAPPTPAERRSIPADARIEGAELIQGLRERGAVTMTVAPRRPFFGGRVLVLTDSGSRGASELLAHHLRASGRATLVGARTAGRVMVQVPHAVGDGWVVLVPEADIRAADGTRLGGAGVTPHIAASSRDAPTAAAREVARYEPADGALLIGIAFAARQRWDSAFVALDRALELRPDHPLTLYHLGRMAALSGLRLDRGEEALRAVAALPVRPDVPSRALTYWRLGQIQEARGAFDAARREYVMALQVDPRNADVLAALGALTARMR